MDKRKGNGRKKGGCQAILESGEPCKKEGVQRSFVQFREESNMPDLCLRVRVCGEVLGGEMRAHRRVERVCPPPCGKPFMARVTDINRGKGVYCGRRCSARAGRASFLARRSNDAGAAGFVSLAPIPNGLQNDFRGFLESKAAEEFRIGSLPPPKAS